MGLKESLFIFFIFFISSCQTPENQEVENNTLVAFFDLKQYFQQEAERLTQLNPEVKKTVFIDGKKEEIEVEDLDFQKELEIFKSSDINRPAWSSKYTIDSTFQNGKLSGLSYTAEDEKLKTKSIKIDFQNDQISLIEIKNLTKSTIANSQQILEYQPLLGYTIKSIQEISFSKEHSIIAEVKFQK